MKSRQIKILLTKIYKHFISSEEGVFFTKENINSLIENTKYNLSISKIGELDYRLYAQMLIQLEEFKTYLDIGFCIINFTENKPTEESEKHLKLLNIPGHKIIDIYNGKKKSGNLYEFKFKIIENETNNSSN